jgi:hypothetical protein
VLSGPVVAQWTCRDGRVFTRGILFGCESLGNRLGGEDVS